MNTNVDRPTTDQDLSRQIQEASPAQLHAMLLGIGQKFLKLAITAMQEQDIPSKSRHLSRVSEIILELESRINHEAGGELAANLSRIYSWWNDVLFDASQKNQPDRLVPLLNQMADMQISWETLHKDSIGRVAS